jgi:hypothetical protein
VTSSDYAPEPSRLQPDLSETFPILVSWSVRAVHTLLDLDHGRKSCSRTSGQSRHFEFLKTITTETKLLQWSVTAIKSRQGKSGLWRKQIIPCMRPCIWNIVRFKVTTMYLVRCLTIVNRNSNALEPTLLTLQLQL